MGTWQGRREGRKRAGKRDFGANSLTSTAAAARILAAALLLGVIITVVREMHTVRLRNLLVKQN